MARRPDREKAEVLSEKDLKELRYNLAHLSVSAVREFYGRAYQDCRLVYNRLPSPRKIQTLVQVWKQFITTPANLRFIREFRSGDRRNARGGFGRTVPTERPVRVPQTGSVSLRTPRQLWERVRSGSDFRQTGEML